MLFNSAVSAQQQLEGGLPWRTAAGVSAVPGVRDIATAFDMYRWGHAMLTPEKGFVFGAARVGASAPLGGLISFAHHDVDGLPAFENAVAAGYRAADEVAMTLGI